MEDMTCYCSLPSTSGDNGTPKVHLAPALPGTDTESASKHPKLGMS